MTALSLLLCCAITNGLVSVKIEPPDSYKGTRFDHSGIISDLQTNGHRYYGPWFDEIDPNVPDFIDRNGKIVAGLASSITGPADEFAPIGFDDAKRGETFVKIGIGALRKPDDQPYSQYRIYQVANPGKWDVLPARDQVEFVQELSAAGYAYRYEKIIRLTPGKRQLIVEHRLRNSGSMPISTTAYNHNFLVLDHRAPGPGLIISFPFALTGTEPSDPHLAEVVGHQIRFLQTLKARDTFYTPIAGFGSTVDDNTITIEDSRSHAGVKWHTGQPLTRLVLWSIRTTVAVEPFIQISIPPGREFSWTATYDYFNSL